ncbi:MAG: type II toxin-antitoxin system VapC family toxin [Dehalococcoidia bacterium]
MALILDAGPMLAVFDRTDADHQACRRLLETTIEPLIIPAPVLVELDYWIHARLHPGVLIAFLDDITAGAYLIEDLLPQDYHRVRELCDRYADADIGFVDAAVLAVVERLNEPKLATLDRRHFGMLRPRHVDALRLLPE